MGASDINKMIAEAQKPLKECPSCGNTPITTTSFNGRAPHRKKRLTQHCDCGWSCIIPTYTEALVQLGLV